jgi:hypothetical protein
MLAPGQGQVDVPPAPAHLGRDDDRCSLIVAKAVLLPGQGYHRAGEGLAADRFFPAQQLLADARQFPEEGVIERDGLGTDLRPGLSCRPFEGLRPAAGTAGPPA